MLARGLILWDEPPPPPRPLSAQERVLTVMVRNAMFARVAACARDDLDALLRLERAAADRFDPPREVVMTRSRWDAALEDYYAEHQTVGTDADARGPAYFWMGPEETGSRPEPRRVRRPGCGRSGRRSPTRPATATGWSRPWSTSTRPTTRGSWCSPRRPSGR